MKKTEITRIVRKAHHLCDEAGVKLTEKRKSVLSILLQNDLIPMSAYDVADTYKKVFSDSLPVMSVYRMLDFLVEEKLAHKLESTNQYLACSHISCEHEHTPMQFLICDKCHVVNEILIDKDIMLALTDSAKKQAFNLRQEQLELHGICSNCSQI